MKQSLRLLLLLFLFACAAQAQTWTGSTAFEASRVVKATGAQLMRIKVYNSSTSSQYILIFNAAALQANGALVNMIDVPHLVPAKSTLDIIYPVSLPCSNGIVVCNSSTDTTKTIGSADCWFKAIYR